MGNFLGVAVDDTPAIGQVAAVTFCQQMANTSIATTANGLLTASAIVGGIINRTGPAGNFSDVTDTAQNILHAVGLIDIGYGFGFTINNNSGSVQTITPGFGVTLSGTTTVAPGSSVQFDVLCTGNNPPTATIIGNNPATNSLASSNLILSCGTRFIWPNSVSSVTLMGANGALTGVGPFPEIYEEAWIWCWQSGIHIDNGGNPAGWYPIVMHSVNSGTIYNNPYNGIGAPSFPSVLTPFTGTTPPVSNIFIPACGTSGITNTFGIPSISIPIPTNLGPNGSIDCRRVITMSPNTDSKVFTIYYGGTPFIAQTMNSGTVTQFIDIPSIFNRGSALINSGTNFLNIGTQTGQYVNGLINSNVPQPLNFSCALPSAADWAVQEYVFVKTNYGA